MRSRKPHKKTLTLNKEKKKFLGVCAGIADYLEVEPWSVRMVFVVSMFFGGWFLFPLYFIAWFCLDDKPGEGLNNIADSQPLKHFRTVDYRKKLYRNTEDAKFLGVCAGVADYLEVNVFAVRLVFLALIFFAAAVPLFIYFAAYFILEEKPHKRGRQAGRERRYRRHRKIHEGMEAGMEAGMAAAEGIVSSFQEKFDEKAGRSMDRDGNQTGPAESGAEESDVEEGYDYDTRKFSKRREIKYCVRKFATLQDRLAKMEAYVTSNQFRLHREFKNI